MLMCWRGANRRDGWCIYSYFVALYVRTEAGGYTVRERLSWKTVFNQKYVMGTYVQDGDVKVLVSNGLDGASYTRCIVEKETAFLQPPPGACGSSVIGLRHCQSAILALASDHF